MERDRSLHFGLLGTFSCGNTEDEITKNHTKISRMGKKALSFLQYMIINHGRNISSEELIEQFWSDGADPVNALRNMVFRIRSFLKGMFPGEDGIIVTVQDCYAWNPEIRLELDAEQFESLCVKARGQEEEEYCRMLVQAVSLYRGDFLSGNDGEWARTLRQYYQTLYLDACKAVLPILYKKEQWLDLLGICSRAYTVDFSMEEFTAYQMKTLIALGQPEQAVEKYRIFRERLLQEYEMLPTENMEQLHTLALGLRKNDVEERDILGLVCEEKTDSQAFFCTFPTFRSIVALERRHLKRSGQSSALIMISLGSDAVPTTDGRRLERILLEKLRTGDPIARLEAGTYIIMLTGASEEEARTVFGRIDCAFHRTYRHSEANLTFRVTDLGYRNREAERNQDREQQGPERNREWTQEREQDWVQQGQEN